VGNDTLRMRLASWCEIGCFGASGLAVLTKVARETGALPGLLGPLIVAAIVLALCALLLARDGRRWLDGWRAALLILGLLEFQAAYTRIGGDGVQYYVLLRSPLIDGDFDLANDYAGLGVDPVLSPDGVPSSKMPIGVALVWMPTFLVAHGAAHADQALGGSLVADGFGPLYQATVTATNYLLAFLALLFIEAALRRRFGAGPALASVLGIWLASPLHFYMASDPSTSHATSMAMAAAFVLFWLSIRERDEWRPWLWLGLIAGVMVVVRPQDGALLLLPIGDRLLRRPLARALPVLHMGWGLLACGLLQFLVWIDMYGHGLFRIVFHQTNLVRPVPHFWELLFTARHGLFTWTPIVALAVIGWLLWLKRDGRLAALAYLSFCVAVYVNSLMQDWWGASSFGQRRLLGFTALFAFGLAEIFALATRRPLVPIFAFVAALGFWNLNLEWIFNSQALGTKDEALALETVAAMQVRGVMRDVMRWETRLPDRVFYFLWDNLRGVWLDEGSRSLGGVLRLGDETLGPPFLGEGWYKSRPEGDAPGAPHVRESRGPRSRLRVPIRTPSDFEVFVRARTASTELPVTIVLKVNGESVGEIPLTAEWREASLVVPAARWRPGFNQIDLVYSGTPKESVAEHRGHNAAAVFEWIRFERRNLPPGPR
jgi:hypothetical protein